jgi:hypothetical protein
MLLPEVNQMKLIESQHALSSTLLGRMPILKPYRMTPAMILG